MSWSPLPQIIQHFPLIQPPKNTGRAVCASVVRLVTKELSKINVYRMRQLTQIKMWLAAGGLDLLLFLPPVIPTLPFWVPILRVQELPIWLLTVRAVFVSYLTVQALPFGHHLQR